MKLPISPIELNNFIPISKFECSIHYKGLVIYKALLFPIATNKLKQKIDILKKSIAITKLKKNI